MSKRQSDTKSINYYAPSKGLANFLAEELRSLIAIEKFKRAGAEGLNNITKKRKYVRKNPKLAKYKYDYFRKIFQSFIDIIYFLEFIQDHPEMHELYEDNLKELFGYNIDDSYLPEITHYKDKAGYLFYRFLNASLFNRYPRIREIDFRVDLAKVAMINAFAAMERGLRAKKKIIINGNKEIVIDKDDPHELELFRDNIRNARFWSEVISKRYHEPNLKTSNHRIGYSKASTLWNTYSKKP